jgi:hypothetical protein
MSRLNSKWKALLVLLRSSLLAPVLLAGCSNSEPAAPKQPQEVNEIVNGEIVLATEKLVVIRNPIGHVFVDGNGFDGFIRWRLYKETAAETKAQAIDQLNAIHLLSSSREDTAYITVQSPADGRYYFSQIELLVPHRMKCSIDEATGDTRIAQLGNVLRVQSARKVEVLKHSSSCQVASVEGNVAAETILPDGGYCRVFTNNGDIVVKVPAATSAMVFAQTGNGNITTSGLAFQSVNQQPLLLTGILGFGNGEIRLEAKQGNIRLEGF